jgi:hypothetical protein
MKSMFLRHPVVEVTLHHLIAALSSQTSRAVVTTTWSYDVVETWSKCMP